MTSTESLKCAVQGASETGGNSEEKIIIKLEGHLILHKKKFQMKS